MSAMIEIKDLCKNYGKSRGIKDVSLTIEDQEIFGFIGPNGAGKSTTIRCMLGLIKPNAGSVTILGKDALKYPEQVAKEIGYLPSEVFYYDKMKAIDLLNYSASFYEKDCSKRIVELANILEVDLNKKIDEMSYGNKKKVGIIQGLLHSPKLIILDEPTGGLDPLMQQRFFDILRQENEKGATILFSSHILSEVQKMCHRIAIIKDGEIVQVSDMKALKHQNYQRVSFSCATPIVDQLNKMGNIKDLKQIDDEVTFLYNGQSSQLIAFLATIEINDLFINEPSLEEIFMHYYE